jgi:hypothetical protein
MDASTRNILNKYDRKWAVIQKRDAEARAKGTLVGRYIQEGRGDGYAIYTIIRETAKKVVIRVETGIGDDWVIPYWGEQATIDKAYAQSNIRFRDFWREQTEKAA